MSEKQKIINIAVIAHVDAGKSTLVDALLAQSHVFRDNEKVVDCVMDSDAIEKIVPLCIKTTKSTLWTPQAMQTSAPRLSVS